MDNIATAMTKKQWEEEAIERFRSYLSQNRSLTFGITARDVVVDEKTKENFDYQLQNENGEQIAVELFCLVENGEDLARSKVWHTMAGYINEEIKKRGLKGYLVYTPQFFVKKKEMKDVAVKQVEIIEKGIQNNPTQKRFSYEGYEFHKIESLGTISLSYSEGARSVDSRGTATNSLASKLPKKNRQVNIPNHERIIVIVNWSFFVGHDDTIRVLSSFDFQELQNIDKIYFEVRNDEFHLIFDRAVIEALKAKQKIENKEALKLLIEYLKHQLADKKQDAFDFVKTIAESSGNLDWIEDTQTRENIVQYGSELLAQDQIEDAMWIVRVFQNDTDPNPSGANDPDDPKGEHNYHAKILRGEDANIITTVRGHLCWLMMKIVGKNKPEYYSEIIEIMSRYLKEDNLYIRTQATYILEILWANRHATKNADESPLNWDNKERVYIRQLVLDTVRANKSYPQVMRGLLHVFNRKRDLNEDEAEEMLTLFLNTGHKDVLHDLAAYVVYFAFFREADSKYYGGKFNSERFVALLKDQIKNGDDSISSSLAWHLWKLLTDKVLPYEVIKEYLPLFLEGKYSANAMSKLALIIEELSKTAPQDAVILYERALEKLDDHLKNKPEESHQHWINGTEEVLPLLAKEPKRLLAVVKRLKDMWMRKAQLYVGNIKTIFESYELVPTEMKEETKVALKVMYDEMKAVHPPLQEVDWSK